MDLPAEFIHKRLRQPWGRVSWWERRGDHPPVLFLHGAGCDSTDWVPLIGHLPKEYRLLLADFRGHGRTDMPAQPFGFFDLVDDVEALLDHLGEPQVVPAGHSLGGMVAMELAQRRPELVGALALFEAWPRRDAVPRGWDKGPSRLPGAERQRINTRTRRTIARVGVRNWLEFWNSLQQFDGRPFLQSHRVRTIAVWGDRGRRRPTYQELGMPPSLAIQHLWIDGAGHYLMLERPRIAAQAVVRLARRLRG